MNAQESNDCLDDSLRSNRAIPTVRSQPTSQRSTARVEHGRHAQAVIGVSVEWRTVLEHAARGAATEATTCLEGESGTGKEVVARFIHEGSPRRRGPFVAINCAALPEQLLESELFGFERGAFTGADHPKAGQIELAAGGVLFLDEVTELTLAAQAKCLRVLQEREFVRLGGTRPIRSNVRVVAATNRDLSDAVAGGKFRSDLYFRLNVFNIHIPPLRHRCDDIIPLAAGFLREFADVTRRPPAELTPKATEALLRHDWPGNVRELRNVLERASIVCEDGVIGAEDLSLLSAPAALGESTNLDLIERRAIERVMRDVNGNKAKASRQLESRRPCCMCACASMASNAKRTWSHDSDPIQLPVLVRCVPSTIPTSKEDR